MKENNRRKYNRLEKEYRLEYGPLSELVEPENLKASVLKNLSGGGILFCADEPHPVGSQLFLKIYVAGWSQCQGKVEKVSNQDSELLLKVIAEVLHVDSDPKNKCFWIGAKFLGQLHS